MNRSSVVTPNVDLSKVEAINQKRTLAFINHWVLHTVGFLNQFSAVCEERLIDLNTKLRRADQSLAILEAKLKSVPDLEGVTAPSSAVDQSNAASGSASTTKTEAPGSSNEVTTAMAPPAPIEPQPQSEMAASIPEEPKKEEDESPAMPVSKDPRFVSYFKMLAVGVPLPAVKMKMTSEGLDPSVLDDPNAPAPPMDEDITLNDDSDSSSVSSFSD